MVAIVTTFAFMCALDIFKAHHVIAAGFCMLVIAFHCGIALYGIFSIPAKKMSETEKILEQTKKLSWLTELIIFPFVKLYTLRNPVRALYVTGIGELNGQSIFFKASIATRSKSVLHDKLNEFLETQKGIKNAIVLHTHFTLKPYNPKDYLGDLVLDAISVVINQHMTNVDLNKIPAKD